jgi:hypothetical protein
MKKTVLGLLLGAIIGFIGYRYLIQKKLTKNALGGLNNFNSGIDSQVGNSDVVDDLLIHDYSNLFVMGNMPYSVASPEYAIINAVYVGNAISVKNGFLLLSPANVRGYVCDENTFVITGLQVFPNEVLCLSVPLNDIQINY